MGLLGLFGKGPLSEKKIEKITKLASNPFAQPDVRMREMARLLHDGSDAALRGVLKRFAANANGHIADEEEKQWLEDKLVDRGDEVVAPLENYIKTEQKLTYALRAHRRLVGDARAMEFFLEVLDRYGPEDYRGVEAKLQLIWQLTEMLDLGPVLERLVPYLRDHSDDVSWAVMEQLDAQAEAKTLSGEVAILAAGQLGHLVTDTSVGPRIAQRAAELVCKHEWKIPGDSEELASGLEETYFLDKKRYIRRRAKARA